jgi:hypothetical protein
MAGGTGGTIGGGLGFWAFEARDLADLDFLDLGMVMEGGRWR